MKPKQKIYITASSLCGKIKAAMLYLDFTIGGFSYLKLHILDMCQFYLKRHGQQSTNK